MPSRTFGRLVSRAEMVHIPSHSSLSPTQAEEALRNELKVPKKVAHEALERYVRKPAGKPTLVPLSDKRPELESYEENLWDDEGMFDDDDDEL